MALSKGPLYQAELYAQVNEPQLVLEPIFLKRFQHLLKWRKNGNVSVLDVGSGTGCTTIKVLRPFLPENFIELIGLDGCPAMYNFAISTYEDEKTKFVMGDITKDMPLELVGRFDHVFSMYCLHIVQDHKASFKNFYKVLQPDGSIFVFFMLRFPLYDVYEVMAKEDKWSVYMKDVEKHLCPLLHSKDPVKDCSRNAEDAGFEVTCCEVFRESWTYANKRVFRDFLSSVNTYMTTIPPELQEEFMEDILAHSMKHEFTEELSSGEVKQYFTIIILTGEKHQ